MRLEQLTKPNQRAQADDAAGQAVQGDMRLGLSFEADTQLSKRRQPRMGALDHSAVTPQSLPALDTSARDAHLDAPGPQMAAATLDVVALVGMQLVGPPPRTPPQPRHRRQRIDQLLEHHRVMSIRPRHAEHQRHPCAVGDKVAFAAELAPVRRVRPRELAPRGLATLAPSTHARLKSS